MSSIWTIRRSATDAKLTGLCGGVARYWGIDPVLVRVGAVLLALSGGIGVVLYLAGWLLIPADGRQTSILYDAASPAVRKWPKEAWVVIVAVICFIVFAALGFTTPFGFMPAIVLALIWYFGYYKNRSGRSARNAPPAGPPGSPQSPTAAHIRPPTAAPEFRYPGPATPFTAAADAWRQRVAEVSRESGSMSPPSAGTARTPPAAPFTSSVPASAPPRFPLYADAPPTSDPRLADPEAAERAAFLAAPDPAGLYTAPDRELATVPSRAALARTRSARRLRLLGLVVLGLTLTGLGIADAIGVSVSPAIYVGAALLVVGLTLVAATWFGRARGILPVGLVLALALVSITVVNVPGRSDAWSRTVSYATLASLPTSCEQHDVGALTVDLSKLSVPRSGSYCAHVDGGRLEVIAPGNANVVVKYRVDGGVVVENGEPKVSGTDLVGTLQPPAPVAGRPTLTLDLSVDVGEVRVQR